MTPWPARHRAFAARSSSLSTGFVLLWLIVAAFPFLWTVWGSFKVEADFFSRDRLAERHLRPRDRRADRQRLHRRRLLRRLGRPGASGSRRSTRPSSRSSVVVISLTIGTLGGYALARSGYRYTFWILIAALVFRAMPHITLVSGYLLPFFELNIWGILPTTIIVLVAINQPFTLWMLHSFFLSIPQGSRRERHGRRLHALPGLPPGGHPGDVAGRRHHGPLQLPARLQRLRGHRDAAQRRTTRPWCRRSRASSARSRPRAR